MYVRNPNHLGDLGVNLKDVVSTFVQGADAKIIFRSQLSPEIIVSLNDVMAGREGGVQPRSGTSQAVLRFIKPEVTIQAAGVEKVSAPYGRPSANYFTILLAGGFALTVLGGAIAWRMCRG